MIGDGELSRELASMLNRGTHDAEIGKWARVNGNRLVDALAAMDDLVIIPQIDLSELGRLADRRA